MKWVCWPGRKDLSGYAERINQWFLYLLPARPAIYGNGGTVSLLSGKAVRRLMYLEYHGNMTKL